MTEMIAVALVFCATIIGSSGALFFKKGSATIHRTFTSFLTNYNLFAGAFLYALSSAFFIPALKYGDLSLVYPMTSLTYIWVTLLSVKFLGERITLSKGIGISLIVLGISLIGYGS